MPRLKPGDVPLTDEEEAAVQAGIAADPDNPELGPEVWATAKRIWELPEKWLGCAANRNENSKPKPRRLTE